MYFIKTEDPNYTFTLGTRSGDGMAKISDKEVRNLWRKKEDSRWLENFKKGFCFDRLTWNGLRKLIFIILKVKNADNESVCKYLVEKVSAEILLQEERHPCVSDATADELSWFFGNISQINKDAYDKLINEECIVNEVRKRLNSFGYTSSEIYLFSHFYSQDWCKTKMNSLIDKANKEQQKVIKEWHDKVVAKLDDGVEIEHGSLLEYIHNKFFNEQQNN